MSTATRFKHIRPFTFCLAIDSLDPYYDFADIPLEDAMAIWWNLEVMELHTTGTGGPIGLNYDIIFGPSESFPGGASGSNAGSYYTGAVPAAAPSARVCWNSRLAFVNLWNHIPIAGQRTELEVAIIMTKHPSDDSLVRVGYYFNIFNRNSGNSVVICSPAVATYQGFTGSPAISGAVSVLGLTLNYVGGGLVGLARNASAGPSIPPAAWGYPTSGLSVAFTSGAYTY